MYSLIRFNTGEYTILKSKNVEKTELGTCVAKYRSAKYSAFVVASSDRRSTLSNLQDMYEMPSKNEQYDEPAKLPGKVDSSSTSNIRCHVNKKRYRRKLSKRKRNVTATNNKYNKNQSNVDENRKLLQKAQQNAHISLDEPNTIDSDGNFDSDEMSATKQLLNDTLNMRHDKSTYVENSSLPPSAKCDTIVIANDGCEIFLKKAEFIADITNDKPTHMINSNSAFDSDKISNKKALSNDNNLQNTNTEFSEESCFKNKAENNSNKEFSCDLSSGDADEFSSSECIQNLSSHMSEHELEKSNKTTKEKADKVEIDVKNQVNEKQISVPYSKNNCKKRFCIFCKKLQSKISRHLYLRHKHEKEVKKALRLERLHVINNIGKRGGFEHNTTAAHTSGVLIVNRQQHTKSKNMLHDFIFCKTCKKCFSKRTIHIHKKRCSSSKVERMNVKNDMKNSNTETLNLAQEKKIFCYKTRSITKSGAALAPPSSNNDENSSNKKYLHGMDSGQTDKCASSKCIQDPSADMDERTIENSKESTRTTETDAPVNLNQILLPYSESRKKKHFCIYCKKLQYNISQHLFLIHKHEKEVKKALSFPKKSQERLQLINDLRKRGDFQYNTPPEYNSGVLIISRRHQRKYKNMVHNYICCKTCKGFFSKRIIRIHKKKCSSSKVKGSSQIDGYRMVKYRHPVANTETLNLPQEKIIYSYKTRSILNNRALVLSSKSNDENSSGDESFRGWDSGQTDKCSSSKCIQDLSADITERTLENFNKTTREKDGVAEIVGPLNVNQISVPYSQSKTKRHFCIFCKDLQTNISRHLFLKHKHEKEVKQAFSFPKKSKERLQLIDEIRKRGDFVHNTSPEYNTGILIVSRQQQRKFKNMVHDYICCKTCKGFFSKKTIRIHKNRCSYSKVKRNSEIDGHRMTPYSQPVAVANDLKKSNIETLGQPQNGRIYCYKTRSTSKNSTLVLSSNINDENTSNKKHFPFVDSGQTDKSSSLECSQDLSSDMSERTLQNSSKTTTEKDDIVEIVAPLNVNQVLVPYSESRKKKHFCIYCKKLKSAISRHLFLMHKREKDVIKALSFPKKSKERLQLINDLRKRGDFEHNTSAEYNSGILIVSRQQQRKFKKMVDDYVCCKTCKGFFSKRTIRLHKKKCRSSKGERCYQIDGRKMTQYIHPVANNLLKTKIFPILRCDDVVKSIRYDELTIKFGNYLAEKYPEKNFHDLTRAKLRLIGRFKIQFKKVDNAIDELKDIFKEHMVEKCIKAVRNTVGWNGTLRRFENPAVAQNLTLLIKKLCKIQRIELIRKNQKDLQNEVEKFLKLWEEKRDAFSEERCSKKNAENNSKKECSSDLSSRDAHECSSSECIQEVSAAVSQHKLKNSKKTNTAKDTIVKNSSRVQKKNCSSSKDGAFSKENSSTNNDENNSNKECSSDLSSRDAVVCSSSECSQDLSADMSEPTLEKSNKTTTENDDIVEIAAPLNISQVLVPYSESKKKRHFCIYCKELQSKISRHLYLKHKHEKEVKQALRFPKRSQKRLQLINDLRKRGDFEHNTSPEYNSGVLIVSRQQQRKYKRIVDDYACCKTCKGFFSKRTIRMHKRRCSSSKGERCYQIDGRKMTQYIHPVANNLLKTKIFPILRCDDVAKSIRYDELAIKLGNYLAEKYPEKHLNGMIRAKLRLIGRFKIQFKKLDNAIDELKDIFKENLFDKCIKAIRNTVGWNETTRRFETPAAAQNLTSIIKRCCKIQRRELIKENQKDLQSELEKFLKLWKKKNRAFSEESSSTSNAENNSNKECSSNFHKRSCTSSNDGRGMTRHMHPVAKNGAFSEESSSKSNAENTSNKECSSNLSSRNPDERSSSECIPEISAVMSERTLEDSSKTTTAKDTVVKNSTRVHKKMSCSSSKDGRRMAQDIHPVANNLLKNNIFPILRCDDVVESIRHDELAIKFGNYLAEKYPQKHLHNMIRAKLRLIGRFKIQFKKLDNAIDELKDIYKEHLFDKCVKAIRNTVGWNETYRRFENAAAQNLTSIIKKCWMILRVELIRENQKDLQGEVEKFIELWEEKNGAFSEESSSTKNVENNSNKECSSDLSSRNAVESSSSECIQDVSVGISEPSNKTNTAKDTIVKNRSCAHKSSCSSSLDSLTLTQHIHPVANNLLKTQIFPILRCDYVVEIIRYDELAIKFGNYLAEQYPQKHLHNMIRAKLRLIGRFKIQFKKLDTAIDELKHIYKEHLFDKCIKAIRNTVGWNETYRRFESPAAAQNLISIIRRCCKIQRRELIKENQKDLQRDLEKFLKLWDGR